MRLLTRARWRPRAARRPVPLVWRRQRRQRASDRVLRTSSTTWSSSWLVHLHLHFATRERIRRDEVRLFAREEQRTLLRSRHSTMTRTNAMTMRTRVETRTPHWSFARGAVAMNAPTTKTFATVAARPSPIPLRIVSRVFERSQRLRVESLRRSSRVSRVTTRERTRVVEERQTRIRTAESRHFHLHVSSRHRVQEISVRYAAPVRRAEIVWRNAPPRAAEVAAGIAPVRATVPLEIAAPPARPSPRMKDFDPALLDRLTDDVIRRVQRRARIERERHGR